MSNKYAKIGWTKYEFPPDMISEEKSSKTMKLSSYQMARQLEQRMNERIAAANQRKDSASEKEWRSLIVRMEKKKIAQRINEEFIIEFTKWLNGKSIYNAKQFEELHYDKDGQIASRYMVTGCPWGSKPLTVIPGVVQFLDQGIDRRDTVIKYLTKLKLTGPRNIDECWMYYKYIIRQVGVDDYAVHEVESMQPYDYPYDPRTGNTVGPSMVPSPPYFNEERYSINSEILTAMVEYSPSRFAQWLANGANPAKISTYMGSKFAKDLYKTFTKADVRAAMDPNPENPLTSAEARERRHKRRERLRKLARPTSKMGPTSFVTVPGSRAGGSSAGLRPNWMFTPEERRSLRRQDRRIEEEETIENIEKAAKGYEEFTAIYGDIISWNSLSDADRDFLLVETLAYGLSEIPTLVTGYGLSSDGAPIVPPPPMFKDTHMTNSLPHEQEERIKKTMKDSLERVGKTIQKALRASDPTADNTEIKKILKSIDTTLKSTRNRMDETFKTDFTMPDFTIPTPIVNVQPPNVNVNVQPPNVNVQPPNVNVQVPSANMPPPPPPVASSGAPQVVIPPIDFSGIEEGFRKQSIIMEEVLQVQKTIAQNLTTKKEDEPMNDVNQPKNSGDGGTPVLADEEMKQLIEQCTKLMHNLNLNPFIQGKPIEFQPVFNNPWENAPGVLNVKIVGSDLPPLNGVPGSGYVSPQVPQQSGPTTTTFTGDINVQGGNQFTGGVSVQGGDNRFAGDVSIDAGNISIENATLNPNTPVNIEGVNIQNPSFQITLDPTVPVTQTITNNYKLDGEVKIDGNTVTVPVPVLNLENPRFEVDMSALNQALGNMTSYVKSIAEENREMRVQTETRFSELIQNLTSVSNQNMSTFNSLVTEVKDMSTEQKKVAGALATLPGEVIQNIKDNMDIEIAKRDPVEALKELGVTKETLVGFFTGSEQAKTALENMQQQAIDQNQHQSLQFQEVAASLQGINAGVAELKKQIFETNKTLGEAPEREEIFQSMMIKQMAKMNELQTQTIGDQWDINDKESVRSMREGYLQAIQLRDEYDSRSFAHRDSIFQLREIISQAEWDLHEYNQGKRGIGHNEEYARLKTNTLQKAIADLAVRKKERDDNHEKYMESLGSVSGYGSAILKSLGDPNAGTFGANIDYVKKAIGNQFVKIEEREREQIHSESQRLVSARNQIVKAMEAKEKQEITPEEAEAKVEKALETIEEVKTEEQERTGKVPLWTPEAAQIVENIANKPPEQLAPQERSALEILIKLEQHRKESGGAPPDQGAMVQAAEAMGVEPATLERYYHFKDVLPEGMKFVARSKEQRRLEEQKRRQDLANQRRADLDESRFRQRVLDYAAEKGVSPTEAEEQLRNQMDEEVGEADESFGGTAPINFLERWKNPNLKVHTKPGLEVRRLPRDPEQKKPTPEQTIMLAARGAPGFSPLNTNENIAPHMASFSKQVQALTRSVGDSGYRMLTGPLTRYLDKLAPVYQQAMQKHQAGQQLSPEEHTQASEYVTATAYNIEAQESLEKYYQKYGPGPITERMLSRGDVEGLTERRKLEIVFGKLEGRPGDDYRVADMLEKLIKAEDEQSHLEMNAPSEATTSQYHSRAAQAAPQPPPLGVPEIIDHVKAIAGGSPDVNPVDALGLVAFTMIARDISEKILEEQQVLSQEQKASIQTASDIGETVKGHSILASQGLGQQSQDENGNSKFTPSKPAMLHSALYNLATKMNAFKNNDLIKATPMWNAAKAMDPTALLNSIKQMSDTVGVNQKTGKTFVDMVPRFMKDSPVTGETRTALLMELDAVSTGLYTHLTEMQRYSQDSLNDYYRFNLARDGGGETFADPQMGGDPTSAEKLMRAGMLTREGYQSAITAEALVAVKKKRLEAKSQVSQLTEGEHKELQALKNMKTYLLRQRFEYFKEVFPANKDERIKYFGNSQNQLQKYINDMGETYAALHESGINAMSQQDAMDRFQLSQQELESMQAISAQIESSASTESLFDILKEDKTEKAKYKKGLLSSFILKNTGDTKQKLEKIKAAMARNAHLDKGPPRQDSVKIREKAAVATAMARRWRHTKSAATNIAPEPEHSRVPLDTAKVSYYRYHKLAKALSEQE